MNKQELKDKLTNQINSKGNYNDYPIDSRRRLNAVGIFEGTCAALELIEQLDEPSAIGKRELLKEIEEHMKETEGENARGTFDQGYEQGMDYATALIEHHIKESAVSNETLNDLLDANRKLAKRVKELEPTLPVVPQFVADWIEEHDNLAPVSKIRVLWKGWHGRTLENELLDYFNNNAEDVMRAILDNDYTIEKEPQWVVKIGKGYFSGYDELVVTYVLDNMIGELRGRTVYNNLHEAETDADTIGGIVEVVTE